MSDETTPDGQFNDPKLAINRVYTRKGDSGETRLVGGQRVAKSAHRIQAYGTVDELNAFVGSARLKLVAQGASELGEELLRVQHELFNLGAVLATQPEDIVEGMARITEVDIKALEDSMDHYNEDLEPLRSFVLPGANEADAELHKCRVICRRAERLVVMAIRNGEEIDQTALRYLNRLSDAFFVWGRWAVHQAGADEVLWQPNMAASQRSR